MEEPTEAKAIIAQEFKNWGITDPTAADWAWGLITTGAGAAQIHLTMYEQPWFQSRFPYYKQAAAAGQSANYTPAELVRMETGYRTALRQQGHDVTNLGPADYAPLVLNDVSPAEFTQRLENYRKVQTVYGPHLRASFEQHAGIPGVSDKDMYGMISGLRPDLAKNYSQATGTPMHLPSFADIQESEKKALAEDQSLFQAGGAALGPDSAANENKRIQERLTTFS